jgi:hypothetical protein
MTMSMGDVAADRSRHAACGGRCTGMGAAAVGRHTGDAMADVSGEGDVHGVWVKLSPRSTCERARSSEDGAKAGSLRAAKVWVRAMGLAARRGSDVPSALSVLVFGLQLSMMDCSSRFARSRSLCETDCGCLHAKRSAFEHSACLQHMSVHE